MANRSRYREMERLLTVALLISLADFVLYLVVAGMGIVWAKVLTAIVAFLIPCAGLVLLFLSKELTKSRSLWLTCGFAGIILCTLVSLLLQFPAPGVK